MKKKAFKQEYKKAREAYLVAELKYHKSQDFEWEYDLEKVTAREFKENSILCENSLKRISNVLEVIRLNKSDLLSALLLLLSNWETQLKDQNLWDKLVDFDSFLHYAIMHNAIDSINLFIKSGKKIASEHLMAAITNHSESAFEFLLKEYKLDKEEEDILVNKACQSGNISILKLLNVSGVEYFTKMIDKGEKIKDIISLVYRYSNMQDADNALKTYIEILLEQNDDQSKNILKEIKESRSNYLNWGTQIAKYRKESDLDSISKMYADGSHIDVKKDIEFGLNNFSVIEKILQGTVEFKLTNEFKQSLPLPEGLKDIPSSPELKNREKFYSMRALLGIFSEAHYQEVLQRAKYEEKPKNIEEKFAKQFKTLRKKGVYTRCNGRYEHAFPFIEAMANLSDAHRWHFMPGEYLIQHGLPEYGFTYKNIAIGGVGDCEGGFSWLHAKAKVEDLWPEIEKLNAQVFSLSREQIDKDPLAFYRSVVEFIWLMGNLTPMERGTGRYVEQWLALVHKYHGLPMPILKPGLQLDCLNITFSLPVYQKLFLNFCEPGSLALPIIEAYRNQCNTDSEMKMLLEHFNIKMDPDPTDNVIFFQKFHGNYDLKSHIAKILIKYKNNSNYFQKLHGVYRADKFLMDDKSIINFLNTGRINGENTGFTFYKPSGFSSDSLRFKVAKLIIENESFAEPDLLSAAKKVMSVSTVFFKK